MKKSITLISCILALVLLVIVGKYGHDYYKYEINVSVEEGEKRKIDEYNFEQ